MYKRIMVAIDGGFMTQAVMSEAVALARFHQAELAIVHAVDETLLAHKTFEMLAAASAKDVESKMREAGCETARQASELARAEGIEPSIQVIESERKHVSDLLVDAAKAWQADLLIVGAHGRRGVERFFVGSVAEHVVRKSPTSLLIVRGQ